MSDFNVVRATFDDGDDDIQVNAQALKRIDLELVKSGIYFKTGISVETDNLFRGNILGMSIIDVIVSDDFVELSGLDITKNYSGLIFNLEYMDRNVQYVLNDFNIRQNELISDYIIEMYDVLLQRKPSEDEITSYYYKFLSDRNSTFKFLEEIINSEEYYNTNSNILDFISVTHEVIFEEHATEDIVDYWFKTYEYNTIKKGDKEARLYLTEKMLQYRQFDYLLRNM